MSIPPRIPSSTLMVVMTTLALSAGEPAPVADRGNSAALGGKDFYPSPEHPVGFRGDGSGYFPGATPVTAWSEGTIGSRKVPVGNGQGASRGQADRTLVLDENGASRNLVWKTQTPAWANTHPIVVGDRVFTYGEPNMLICADANTGAVLWTRRLSIFQAMGLDPAQAERLQAMTEIYCVMLGIDNYFYIDNPTVRPGDDALATLIASTTLPRLQKELEALDPQGKFDAIVSKGIATYQRIAALLKAAKPGDPIKEILTKDFKRNAESPAGPLLNRINELAKQPRHTLRLAPTWGNWIGNQMSSPVSDGRFVYASFGQGATACYDLNGTVIWSRYMPRLPGGSQGNSETVQSPMLADGVLADVHLAGKEVVGLDAKTGAERWRVPTQGNFTFLKGSGYYVASNKIVALPGPDGRPVNLLVTSLCNIIRMSDGKILGVVPYDAGPASGGPSIINVGDIVMKGMTGDAQNYPYVAYRLAFDGPDKVVGKEIWRFPKTPGQYHGQVATPGYCLFNNKDGVVDPQTGLSISTFEPLARNSFSNIVAGTTFFWNYHKDHWGDTRTDGLVTTRFGAADITDPRKVKFLSDSFLGGRNLPRCIEYEKYAPELMSPDLFWGSWGGKPFHSTCVDTLMFPSGNRLFIRTATHLYCIGDPAVKYDWNPASRPKAIADGLKN